MWHASISHPEARVRAQIARKALKGVGSEKLGEWGNQEETVFHLRRRLTKPEEEIVGEVVDLRGTEEGAKRLELFVSSMRAHPKLTVLIQLANMELNSKDCPILIS